MANLPEMVILVAILRAFVGNMRNSVAVGNATLWRYLNLSIRGGLVVKTVCYK
jgi:hypothetical protein